MDKEEKQDSQSAEASNNSIAFNELNIGGNVGDIRIGHTIGYTAEQVSVLLTQIKSEFQVKPFDGRCPYKGLDVFEEEDAEFFFGREKLVEALLERVKESRTLFVTGPSGSGKSSLVRAGLIHALKEGALKNSERWLYETMKPGRDPIGELGRLASSLASSTNAEDEVRAKAMADKTIFARWCEIALKDRRDKRAVIFIDQFEEVFTQINKEEERAAFLNLLTHVATVENGRVIILFSMRSDFVSNCATYPELNALLNRQFIQIGAMQPEELVSAMAQPALRVGLRIDPDLIAQVINDMKSEPGALPLMQFAMKELFDARQAKGGVIALTLSDYLKHGGIDEALERHADDSIAKLSGYEQALARNIFSGLVEIGRGTEDTRRTALFNELVPSSSQAEDVHRVIQKLADARLVTTEEKDSNKYTITHEKLIDAWPWLKRLVNENRDAIALHNEIANDAKEWEENKGDASYLYTGARLAIAQEQLTAQRIVLNGLANDFINEGIKARNAERKAKEIFRRRITLGLISGIVIALALAAFAVSQMLQAQRQSRISRSQALAANSQLQKSKNQLSLLLALEAFRVTTNLPHVERLPAEQAVRDSLSQVSGNPILFKHENTISELAFSPDWHWLATASDDHTIHLWDLTTPTAVPIILRGHESYISALTFSPDGHWLATGSLDASVRLWDMTIPDAKPLTLHGHEDGTASLAFSPDGHWLATGSFWLATGGDATVLLWDMTIPDAKPIVLREHKGIISNLAFSPDGRWLATVGQAGFVTKADTSPHLWDMGNLSAGGIILNGHQSAISTLAFSPDGHWLATGSEDNAVNVWDMTIPYDEPIVLRGHEGEISALDFSPDRQQLATASLDATVRVWNMTTPDAEPIILRGVENSFSALTFSPDGQWLATASLDATVRLWDMTTSTGEPIILRGHEGHIYFLTFRPDGHWLATGSIDATVRLWEINASNVEPIVLRGHESSIFDLDLSPDGHWLATGSRDKTVRLWDMSTPSTEPIVLRGEDNINFLTFSPDGRWLATGSGDTTFRLWDVTTNNTKPIVLPGQEGRSSAAAFSPDRHWLATASGAANATIRLWDMTSPDAEPVVLRGHEGSILALEFSPDGRWLATGSFDAAVRLWDMTTPDAEPIILREHEGWVSTLEFSPDGHWLATGGDDATFHLWDMTTPAGKPIILPGHENNTKLLAFSPDGHWLATGGEDATPHLWDMTTLSAEPIILRGHEGWVSTLEFSPDGHWLATGGIDDTVRLWNLTTPTAESIILRGHEAAISDIVFSPDGHWLATGSEDATVRRWNLSIDELAATACKIIGRNFTRSEWAQYFPNEEYRKTCEQWPLEPEATSTP